ncbi:MAG: hypothetical protein Q8L60_13910 [Gammaproteobacteria bacterium]|nr:hypothetical protein [Gammaproteobacteria bacterium]MDP2346612.1 hypothetical protein [Gammaproteobacteria bacterium]
MIKQGRDRLIFKMILPLCWLSLAISADAQEHRMFAVAASPLNQFTEDFPVVLYEIAGSEFLEVGRIAEQQDKVFFVRPYHDHGLILVGSEPEIGSIHLTVVDINDIEDRTTFEVDICENCILAFSHLLEMPDNQLTYAFVVSEVVQGTATLHVEGIILESGTRVPLTLADLQYAVNFGFPGGSVDGGDQLRSIYSVGKEAVFGYYQQLPLNWTLPEELTLKPEDTIFQMVNTNDIRVITTPTLRTSEDSESTVLYVYDKPSQGWSSITVNGNLLRVRGFKDWVATEEAYRESEIGNVKFNFSAGTFLPAEERIAYSQTRQTGRLYLYNASSKVFIEHMTGNPDSEVLLIDGADIYIRVGDELRKGQIAGDQLADQEVLVKAPEVLDIHWLAISTQD